MTVTASPVPILKDNYAWLLRDSDTGATAIVDPADAQPIIEAIEVAGGRLDLILLTHHHADHIAGVDEVRARFDCPVVGVRVVRLPDHRFRIEGFGPFELPRDDDGQVNVTAATQMITDVIEGWVREYPGQYLWFHRRWR